MVLFLYTVTPIGATHLALERNIIGGLFMEEIVRKGMRLRKPRVMKITLRPDLYEFLENVSNDAHCALEVLARGILEDFRDKFLTDQEG